MTKPMSLKAIQQFGVFAEYLRQVRHAKEYRVDEAKGYGEVFAPSGNPPGGLNQPDMMVFPNPSDR